MEDEVKWGNYTVDFDCAELHQRVTVFDVRAADGKDAENRAKQSLNSGLTWRCTGIDRKQDW